jgi:5-methylcytosine-specific restriction endonuclease McrA
MGDRPYEFDRATQLSALVRQEFRCASCGEPILMLGQAGREAHPFGEMAHAHHKKPISKGGRNDLSNCVIICESCHYSVHEGGRYATGTVVGRRKDFPFFGK